MKSLDQNQVTGQNKKGNVTGLVNRSIQQVVNKSSHWTHFPYLIQYRTVSESQSNESVLRVKLFLRELTSIFLLKVFHLVISTEQI